MKNIFFVYALILLAVIPVSGQSPDKRRTIFIHDIQVVVMGEHYLDVSFRAAIGKKSVVGSKTLILSPVLTDQRNNFTLAPLIVQAARGRISEDRRDWVSGAESVPDQFTYKAIHARTGSNVEYRFRVPYREWMRNADLILETLDMGCCDVPVGNKIILLHNENIYSVRIGLASDNTDMDGNAHFVDPLAKPDEHMFVAPASVLENRTEKDFIYEDRLNSLLVQFRQGISILEPSLGSNDSALSELIEAVHQLERSELHRISSIVIAGFASPEGAEVINTRLAEERANALKRFILSNSTLNENLIKIHNGGSDWGGLRIMIEASGMPDKISILDIIDDSSRGIRINGEDYRIYRLQNLGNGATYQYMLDNLFPQLRNAGYIKIYYEDR